jgi:hypothetical protein
MKIEKTLVTKLVIKDLARLDPITVILEDIGPRQGKAIISCYNESWTSYWGGMGERSIAQFICSCDEHYLAKNFAQGISPTVYDLDGLTEHARAHIIKLRRSKDIDKEHARRLHDDAEELSGIEHIESLHDRHASLMHDIYGDDWWYGLPEAPNHKYEYLCRILNAVKDALVTLEDDEPLEKQAVNA